MKRVFIFDTENVEKDLYTNLGNLDYDDLAIMPYTNNSKNLSFEAIKTIDESPCEKQYIYFDVSKKNELDFKITYLVAELMAKSEDTLCYIVAKDGGYAHVKSFNPDRIKLLTSINNFKSIKSKYFKKEQKVEPNESEEKKLVIR